LEIVNVTLRFSKCQLFRRIIRPTIPNQEHGAGKEVLSQGVDTDYDEYHKPDILIFQVVINANDGDKLVEDNHLVVMQSVFGATEFAN